VRVFGYLVRVIFIHIPLIVLSLSLTHTHSQVRLRHEMSQYDHIYQEESTDNEHIDLDFVAESEEQGAARVRDSDGGKREHSDPPRSSGSTREQLLTEKAPPSEAERTYIGDRNAEDDSDAYFLRMMEREEEGGGSSKHTHSHSRSTPRKERQRGADRDRVRASNREPREHSDPPHSGGSTRRQSRETSLPSEAERTYIGDRNAEDDSDAYFLRMMEREEEGGGRSKHTHTRSHSRLMSRKEWPRGADRGRDAHSHSHWRRDKKQESHRAWKKQWHERAQSRRRDIDSTFLCVCVRAFMLANVCMYFHLHTLSFITQLLPVAARAALPSARVAAASTVCRAALDSTTV
jgi:hypothetical protein